MLKKDFDVAQRIKESEALRYKVPKFVVDNVGTISVGWLSCDCSSVDTV